MRAQAVYERAGYRREHFYKILNKKDVSVEEFERITTALGKRPGDLLDNSHADLAPILPLVEQLKAFHPDALPRVAVVLASLKQFVADTWLTGGQEIIRNESRYAAVQKKQPSSSTPAVEDDRPPTYGINTVRAVGRPEDSLNDIPTRRHGPPPPPPPLSRKRRS